MAPAARRGAPQPSPLTGQRVRCQQEGDASRGDERHLEKRSDEDELTVKRRLAIYREQTEPLERYYAERGLLHDVDAEAPLELVTERMLAAIDEVDRP